MPHDTAAITFLLIVAAAPVIWALVCLRRSPYTPWQSWMYFIAVLLTRVLWRTTVPRRLPIPADQGAVVIANHKSSVDPFFIQLAAGRVCHWMVAREYCRHPAFRWFLTAAEAIPTNRGGIDTAATKQAIRYALDGELVGVLPEGRINTTEQLLLPARPGAAMIALRARVPVVPCFIEGAPYGGTPWSPLLMPARVRVVFGQPIDLSAYFDREGEDGVTHQLTLRIMSELARLAGRDNFQPKLAGRRWKPESRDLETDTNVEPPLAV
jgi:1-acyl-sn-glycerol-3-phosphate acyltransferase